MIDLDQYKCSHCGGMPIDFYDNDIYDYLFAKAGFVFDAYGSTPPISSGYRCTKHPLTKGLSAHTFGVALDVDLSNVIETRRFAECVEDTYADFRMGVYATGGRSFVHIDVAFLVSPRGSEKWREGARWGDV